jgi:hypothetical protein
MPHARLHRLRKTADADRAFEVEIIRECLGRLLQEIKVVPHCRLAHAERSRRLRGIPDLCVVMRGDRLCATNRTTIS